MNDPQPAQPDSPPLTEAEIKRLLRDFHYPYGRENKRLAAERTLHAHVLEITPLLFAQIEREIKRLRWLGSIERSMDKLFCIVGLGTYPAALLLHCCWGVPFDAPWLSRLSGFFYLPLFAWKMVGSLIFIPFRQSSALSFMQQQDDLRLVGPLCVSLYNEGYASQEHLLRLLNRMQATDAEVLAPEHRVCLYKLLRRSAGSVMLHKYSDDLRLAILKALEQIGTAEAIPHVKYVARWARSAEVRSAAEACLPFLEQRAEAQTVSDTLLRASGATSAQPAELLRAAPATPPETEPSQLLRAGSPDE